MNGVCGLLALQILYILLPDLPETGMLVIQCVMYCVLWDCVYIFISICNGPCNVRHGSSLQGQALLKKPWQQG